ncbi:hypothetical protein [Neisseria cinerea]|uniref:hypothetical protein n=1 Tax=Neisseria cinerea TaxID=483 RepID=UPI00288AAAB5|nr:hypothetical protein [Neisseria cinerea]
MRTFLPAWFRRCKTHRIRRLPALVKLSSSAEGTRFIFAHPQYGNLIGCFYADYDTDKLQIGQEIRISVDKSQMVWFD